MHSTVQERLQTEIQEMCGNRLPSFTDIPSMAYALCIMYETMRLFPVLGSIPHRTEGDEMLFGKHLIPKNTCIGLDLVSLHRNEKYWGNTGDEFNPSRFDNRVQGGKQEGEEWHTLMDGKIKIPLKGAFFPFGEGPRACLGCHHSRYR
jgi:cytochrome P450